MIDSSCFEVCWLAVMGSTSCTKSFVCSWIRWLLRYFWHEHSHMRLWNDLSQLCANRGPKKLISPINASERQGLSWLCDSHCSFFYSWSEKHGCSNAVMKWAETRVEIHYNDLVKIVKWLLTAVVVLALYELVLASMNMKHISRIYNMSFHLIFRYN